MLNALVEKGQVKVGSFARLGGKLNKIGYLLTPEGLQNRMALTRKYLERKTEEQIQKRGSQRNNDQGGWMQKGGAKSYTSAAPAAGAVNATVGGVFVTVPVTVTVGFLHSRNSLALASRYPSAEMTTP